MSHVSIYTDGCCDPNPGAGGWSFVVYVDDKEHTHGVGGAAGVTNNVMELTAVLRALQWLARPENRTFAKILSDSRYVVEGCNSWRHSWKKRDWRRAKKYLKGDAAAIANKDLWIEVDRLLSEDSVPAQIVWVRGHDGNVGNERADYLAFMAAGETWPPESSKP